MLHLQRCKFRVDRFFFFFFLFHSLLSRYLSFWLSHPGRTLTAVFNPRSLSANHSKRKVSIHPGINSRDFSPHPIPLSLFLSHSFGLFFISRGSTMACRSAGARRSFGINGRARHAIFSCAFRRYRVRWMQEKSLTMKSKESRGQNYRGWASYLLLR